MKTPRTCEICGVDISDRSCKAKICADPECDAARKAAYRAKHKKQRFCKVCGVDITHMHPSYALCSEKCTKVRQRQLRRELYHKKHPPVEDRYCMFCGGIIPRSKWYSKKICCDKPLCRERHEARKVEREREAGKQWYARQREEVNRFQREHYHRDGTRRSFEVKMPLNGRVCRDCGVKLRGPWYRRCRVCHDIFVEACPGRLDDGYIYGGGTSPHAMESIMGSI